MHDGATRAGLYWLFSKLNIVLVNSLKLNESWIRINITVC